jgi:hypothetical protein
VRRALIDYRERVIEKEIKVALGKKKFYLSSGFVNDTQWNLIIRSRASIPQDVGGVQKLEK